MAVPEELNFIGDSAGFDAEFYEEEDRSFQILAKVWEEELEIASLSMPTGEYVWCWEIYRDDKAVDFGWAQDAKEAQDEAQEAWRELNAYRGTEHDLFDGNGDQLRLLREREIAA